MTSKIHATPQQRDEKSLHEQTIQTFSIKTENSQSKS